MRSLAEILKSGNSETLEEQGTLLGYTLQRSRHQILVDLFHLRAGLTWRDTMPPAPSIPLKERVLRARLILEETVFELIREGLGIEIINKGEALASFEDIGFREIGPLNMEKLIDGCSDAKVVITGTLSQFGIPDAVFQELVDQNNLDKTDPEKGAYIDEHGKLIKPKDHKPPNIQGKMEELFCKCPLKPSGNPEHASITHLDCPIHYTPPKCDWAGE